MYLLLQAGIPGSQLMLALEPEAASIFCKHIPSERMVIGGKSCLDAFSPKTQNTVRSVGRYQRGNQNPHIKEEQTTQWPKEKVQKDKQRSTKHTHKTKD
jgi:hypothetical protein